MWKRCARAWCWRRKRDQCSRRLCCSSDSPSACNKRRTSGTLSSTRSSVPPLFFQRASLPLQHHQSRVGEQGQRHIAVPGAPRTHFILIESYFALGLFIAFFNLPTAACHAHYLGQRRLDGTRHPVVGPLARIRQAPSDQDEARPLVHRLRLVWQLQPGPLVEPWPLAPL